MVLNEQTSTRSSQVWTDTLPPFTPEEAEPNYLPTTKWRTRPASCDTCINWLRWEDVVPRLMTSSSWRHLQKMVTSLQVPCSAHSGCWTIPCIFPLLTHHRILVPWTVSQLSTQKQAPWALTDVWQERATEYMLLTTLAVGHWHLLEQEEQRTVLCPCCLLTSRCMTSVLDHRAPLLPNNLSTTIYRVTRLRDKTRPSLRYYYGNELVCYSMSILIMNANVEIGFSSEKYSQFSGLLAFRKHLTSS